MGQKVNPTGLRLGINKTWESRWFSNKDFASILNEDINIRKYIAKKYYEAGIARIDIERAAKQVFVKVNAVRPGKLIGKQGKGVEQLKDEVSKIVVSREKTVKVDVFEVKSPDLNAVLAAQSVAQQLEKRVTFRRAMKKVMQQAMKSGARGIKVRVSGRLNGAEMARTERYMEGQVPLHTLRADIDYGTAEAYTTYGLIGVKVWLFKNEIFAKTVTKDPKLSKNSEE
jgi:small subunit ribosomal protein S3